MSDRHPPCRCGCGELADECSGPRPRPLGSIVATEQEREDAREAIRRCVPVAVNLLLERVHGQVPEA